MMIVYGVFRVVFLLRKNCEFLNFFGRSTKIPAQNSAFGIGWQPITVIGLRTFHLPLLSISCSILNCPSETTTISRRRHRKGRNYQT